VVSSRPEGVRLPRFTPTFVVMDLSPLTFEQQQKAILHQLKESKEFEHLSALTQARSKAAGPSDEQCIAAYKANATAAYDAMSALIKSVHGVSDTAEGDRVLQKVVTFFEEASGIPVLLSMMVLFFSGRAETDKLPTARLELYRVAIQAALRRRMPDAAEAKAASDMLSRVAVANHLVQKREFDSEHVSRSLEGLSGGKELWNKMLHEPSGVPLVKILELSADESTKSTFQFTHLSFQEGYFAEATLRGDPLPMLWDRGVPRILDDPWFLNTCVIGSEVMGAVFSERLPSSTESVSLTDQQCKALVALKWKPLSGKHALHTLRLTRSTFGVQGATPLAALLKSSDELKGLKELDFGVPTTVGVDVAQQMSEATIARSGLCLHGALHAAHRDSLGPADAVLIAATVRNFMGDSPARGTLDGTGDWVGAAKLLGGKVATGSSSTDLATTLKEAGCDASALKGCPPGDLKIIGFSASELKASGLSKADLIAIGYSAKELLDAGYSLADLDEDGLSIEAVAMGSPISEVKAVNDKTPSVDDLTACFDRGPLSEFITSAEALKSSGKVDGSNKDVDDKNCVKLAWIVANFAFKEVKEINLPKNDISTAGITALAQLLRLNTTVTGVNLHDNSINDEAADALSKMLSFNNSIQALRLSNNFFGDAGVIKLVEGLMINTKLESMTLEREPIPIKELKGTKMEGMLDLSMKGFGKLSSIVVCKLIEASSPDVDRLILDRNPLAEGSWAVADMLKANNKLKELHLRMVGMGADGAIAIAGALKENATLEKIVLIANSVGVPGAKAFEEMLPFNNSLRHVDLRENRLSPEAIKTLAEVAAKRPDLEMLV